MSSSRFLLLLGLLGAGACHFASDQANRSVDDGALASDGSEIIVDAFLDAIRLSIVATDEETLGSLVAEDFVYKGCKSNYSKSQLVPHLISLPKSAALSFKRQSSRFTNENSDIEFIMAASARGAAKPRQFVLHNRDGRFVLASGKSLNCAKEFPGFLRSEMKSDATDAVIKSLTSAINSQDLTAIRALFTDDFRLEMCDSFFKKQTIVKFLGRIPKGTNFSFKVLSSSNIPSSDDISAHVLLVSPGLNLDADYLLKKNNGVYQIAYGKIRNCP